MSALLKCSKLVSLKNQYWFTSAQISYIMWIGPYGKWFPWKHNTHSFLIVIGRWRDAASKLNSQLVRGTGRGLVKLTSTSYSCPDFTLAGAYRRTERHRDIYMY